MKHDRVSIRRTIWSVVVASAALTHVGCSFTKTVEFRHQDTQRLIDGATPAEVPEELRVGTGAIGILIVPTDDGLRVELAVFFSDLHDQLDIRSVSILSPNVGDEGDVRLVETEWQALDPTVGNALGSLAIANIGEPVAREIYESEMDIVLQVHLRVAEEERVLTLQFDRVAEWWPPNV